MNFRASFGDAEGQTVQQLYHNTDATVYDIVRQVTIEQQGVEARTLCRWSAMLRHKARCQWLIGQYWASILASPQPVNGQPFELVYAESTRANADGVAGWALVHQGAKCPHTRGEQCACELQVEWDEDVWEANVPGCGCKGGKRDPCAGRCLCKGGEKGARHRCGPMCRCLGGPRCANNRKLDVGSVAVVMVSGGGGGGGGGIANSVCTSSSLYHFGTGNQSALLRAEQMSVSNYSMPALMRPSCGFGFSRTLSHKLQYQ